MLDFRFSILSVSMFGTWDLGSWRLLGFGCLELGRCLGFVEFWRFYGFVCFRCLMLKIMVVPLKLPPNFKMKSLFSNHNVNNNVEIHIVKIWQNPIVTFQFPQNARKYSTTPIDLSPNSKQNSFGFDQFRKPIPLFSICSRSWTLLLRNLQ